MTDYESIGEYQPSERNAVGTALTFLFIGLGAGAIIALLFAPKTGRQMRRTLKRQYEEARETLEGLTDQAADIIDKGSEWANAAKAKIPPLSRKSRVK
jgi:gas vesicle protein